MKSSKVINQIRCALRYVSVASWGMLVVALILGMLGYLLTQIEAAGIALQNIGASMAAAAVFYSFLNFLPEVRNSYQDAYKVADIYRELQLLIQSLDVLFIYPYKRVNGVDDKYIEKISAEAFFQSMDLENALEKFDFYKEPSEVHDFSQESKDLGVISFKDYSSDCWTRIDDYAHSVLSESGNLNLNKLNHSIRFLISESAVRVFFHYQNVAYIPYKCALYHTDRDGNKNMKTVNMIIELHKMGDEIYNRLKQDTRFTVYPVSPFKK